MKNERCEKITALFCCNESHVYETIFQKKDRYRMDLEMVARTIQLIIAPAVMITSCCIFTNGLLAHYAAIGERLRITVRERVDLLKETEAGSQRRPTIEGNAEGSGLIIQERLADIDFQIPN